MANEFSVRIAPDFAERYPGASPKATEVVMNLVHTADMLVKRIADLLQPYGVTPSSALVLGILADAEAPLPPHQIAERLIISRATVTGLLDYEALIATADPSRYVEPRLDEYDAAAMCYTSGTTGRPKGVLSSHRALILHSLAEAARDCLGIS